MKLPRRTFLHLAAGAAVLPEVSRLAWAQTYPSRPVHCIVGFPAGGTNDIVARLTGQWLSERLGQQFVIENRPGVGGIIGAEAVANARPDGYTLLILGAPQAISTSLYDKLNFNLVRDITPVAGIVRVPLVMEVNLAVPAKTVPEFIAYTKANPGKLNMASGGYEASTWYGVSAPKNTPAEIIKKLNQAINSAIADPELKARFADLGGTVLAGSPADFGKLIA